MFGFNTITCSNAFFFFFKEIALIFTKYSRIRHIIYVDGFSSVPVLGGSLTDVMYNVPLVVLHGLIPVQYMVKIIFSFLEDYSVCTHSFSISPVCGCFIFLALSKSRKRSLRSPSASDRLSEFSLWCLKGMFFFSFSAS